MKCLYLHGFASGPTSSKAVAFESYFGKRGLSVERLNLRVPSFEHLRLSAMITAVRAAIDRSSVDKAVVIGSSLGGLCAARTAAVDDRVVAAVLLAPAFRLAERWRARMDPLAWARWKETGWLDQEDYMEERMRKVDFGFMEDAENVEREGDGYPAVRVPTLIYHGTRDEVVEIGLSRTFVSRRKQAKLVELDDGHDLAASLPTLLEGTEQFLKEQRLLPTKAG